MQSLHAAGGGSGGLVIAMLGLGGMALIPVKLTFGNVLWLLAWKEI